MTGFRILGFLFLGAALAGDLLGDKGGHGASAVGGGLLDRGALACFRITAFVGARLAGGDADGGGLGLATERARGLIGGDGGRPGLAALAGAERTAGGHVVKSADANNGGSNNGNGRFGQHHASVHSEIPFPKRSLW